MTHSDNLDGTFTNPLIHADYPDPDIIRVGTDFYMVSSSFTTVPGIPICHSEDLVNWKVIGHAYHKLPLSNPAYSMLGGKVAYRGGSWAPSIRHNNGHFYICFCTPAEGFFMCISQAPQGPYEMIPFGTELYDPGLFFDDDGRVYVAHGANGLWLTELTADARSIKSPAVFVSQSAFGTPLEGSHLYKRNGIYYWCVTSRGYNGIQICMRSRQIQGPYESRVICADDLNYAGAGLHQGGFVETETGETWFFMFQDRDWIGRVPILLPVTWKEDWPTLGDPRNYGKCAVTWHKPACPPQTPPALPEGSDHFDRPTLALRWQWNHNPDDARWSLTDRPGHLRLRSSSATDLPHARNTLTQKIVGPESTATAVLDIANLHFGDIAGLAVMGFPYAFIAIQYGEKHKRIVMVNDGHEVASADLPEDAKLVHLRCHASFQGLASFSFRQNGQPFVPLGDKPTMQFSVKSFLGNRFGLFCFNASGNDLSKGYADFDSFELNRVRPANHYSAFDPIHAASFDSEHGIDTQRFAEKSPRQRVVDIDANDWICFNHIDFGNGATNFAARASAIADGGKIEIRIGELDGPIAGTCRIVPTDGSDRWNAPFREHACEISRIDGVHRIYLRFVGEGRGLFWLEYFSFGN